MITLEVGTVIWNERFLKRYVISRVTKTQAIVDVERAPNDIMSFRFNRTQLGETFCEKGDSGYSKDSYCLETPEIIAKYKRAVLERKFSKIAINTLTNDQIIRMLDIANENNLSKSEAKRIEIQREES